MAESSYSWLDQGLATLGAVGQKAIDSAAAVATAKINERTVKAVQPDQTPVAATSPLQTAIPGFTTPMAIVLLVAVVAVAGAVVMLRK